MLRCACKSFWLVDMPCGSAVFEAVAILHCDMLRLFAVCRNKRKSRNLEFLIAPNRREASTPCGSRYFPIQTFSGLFQLLFHNPSNSKLVLPVLQVCNVK